MCHHNPQPLTLLHKAHFSKLTTVESYLNMTLKETFKNKRFIKILDISFE